MTRPTEITQLQPEHQFKWPQLSTRGRTNTKKSQWQNPVNPDAPE